MRDSDKLLTMLITLFATVAIGGIFKEVLPPQGYLVLGVIVILFIFAIVIGNTFRVLTENSNANSSFKKVASTILIELSRRHINDAQAFCIGHGWSQYEDQLFELDVQTRLFIRKHVAGANDISSLSSADYDELLELFVKTEALRDKIVQPDRPFDSLATHHHTYSGADSPYDRLLDEQRRRH